MSVFTDDVVLFASSGYDLQSALEQFAADCEEATGQKSAHLNHGSKLDQTDSFLCVEQVPLFKYVGVLFTSDDRTE